MSWRVLTVVGARPQFIKAAPVCKELRSRAGIEEVLVHTGQHYDREMSEVFFAELGISRPAHELGLGGGSHGAMTGRMLEALERIMLAESPDAVLVYGDTNSTLAGALAAVKLHIPVCHVEAGLRSFRRDMPEEINRVLTDRASTLLLCPTRTAVRNLENEGITDGVHHVGDVMFDATLAARELASSHSRIMDRLGLERGKYCVATLHRAENTDIPGRIRDLLEYISRDADARVVFPVHPRTRQVFPADATSWPKIEMIAPIGYLDMAMLLSGACRLYTDSGGLQKEAYFHGIPCVTMRDETEWLETVDSGWNRLWKEAEYRERRPIDEYGEGRAAARVADALVAL